jgi:hypothetical protein
MVAIGHDPRQDAERKAATFMNAQRKILTFSALVETGTGLALMVAPALVARLLLSSAVLPQGIALARIAGVALLALGAACWQSPTQPANRPEVFRGMLLYNALIASYLAFLGVARHVEALLLWPAVVLHAGVALLLLVTFAQNRGSPASPLPRV